MPTRIIPNSLKNKLASKSTTLGVMSRIQTPPTHCLAILWSPKYWEFRPLQLGHRNQFWKNGCHRRHYLLSWLSSILMLTPAPQQLICPGKNLTMNSPHNHQCVKNSNAVVRCMQFIWPKSRLLQKKKGVPNRRFQRLELPVVKSHQTLGSPATEDNDPSNLGRPPSAPY